MKFRINAEVFRVMFDKFKDIAKASTMPTYAGRVLIHVAHKTLASQDALNFTIFRPDGGAVQCVAQHHVTVLSEHEETICFSVLYDNVKAFSLGCEGDLTFTTADDKKSVTITCGKKRMSTPDVEFFGHIEPELMEKFEKICDDSTVFSAGIQHGRNWICDDEARPSLCGFKVEYRDGSVAVVSTNGHGLSMYARKVKGQQPFDFIVPDFRAEWPQDSAIYARKAGSSICEIGAKSVDPNGSEFTIMAKTIDAGYPNYLQVLPDPTNNPKYVRFEVDRAALLAKIINIFMCTKTKAIDQKLLSVVFKSVPGENRLIIKSGERGADVEDEIEIGENEKDVGREHAISVPVHPQYAISVLKSFDCERINIFLADYLQPVAFCAEPVFAPTNRDQFIQIAMPMRA